MNDWYGPVAGVTVVPPPDPDAGWERLRCFKPESVVEEASAILSDPSLLRGLGACYRQDRPRLEEIGRAHV